MNLQRYTRNGHEHVTATKRTLTTTSGSTMPPEGTYLGTLVEFSEPFRSEQYPDQTQVYLQFEIEEVIDSDDDDAGDFVGESVRAYANYIASPNAKLRKWIDGLLGRRTDDNEDIDVDGLLGRQARLRIGPGEKSEKLRVLEVSKYSKPKAAGRKTRDDDEAEEPF